MGAAEAKIMGKEDGGGARMEILCIFLYENRYLEDFMDVLIEEGVEDLLVAEAQELKEFLAFRMPLFKEFRTSLGGRRKEPKLILALVKGEDAIEKMVRAWKKDLEFDKEEIAAIFSLPVRLWQKSPHFY